MEGGGVTAREFAERLELRERLAAIVDELRLLDADEADVPLALAEGLLEDFTRLTLWEATRTARGDEP